MFVPLRCTRQKPHTCGYAWFSEAAGRFPVCPKCRTMVSKTKGRLHLVWPGEPRPDGDHGWLSVDVSRYHREPVLVLNVQTTLEDDDGTTYPVVESVVVDHRRFGIAPDALDDAVTAAGGNRYREGQHPVSDRIRAAVLEKMGWVADVDAVCGVTVTEGENGVFTIAPESGTHGIMEFREGDGIGTTDDADGDPDEQDDDTEPEADDAD